MKYDQEFESSLSELAYSALQNSFSDLVKRVVGFQLVDANDEKTKALSIFAIEMGGSHYYIPVFFISGKLKPLELIYDKKNDMFLPLERDWVDLLSKNEQMDIGESMKMPRTGLSNPNLEAYANPPRTGRVVTSSSKLNTSDIDKMLLMKEASQDSPFLLAITLSKPLVKKAFMTLMRDHPEYTERLLGFYDWQDIKNACTVSLDKQASAREEFYILDNPLDKRASPADSKIILEEGLAVIDKRAGMASDAFFADAVVQFETVNDTGMYKIMDSSGEVKNYLACQINEDKDENRYKSHQHMDRASNNHYEGQRMCIIDLRDGTMYEARSEAVLGQRNHDERNLMNTILEALPTVSEMTPGQKYVLILKKGDSYVTEGCFEISSKINKDGMDQFTAKATNCWNQSWKIIVRPGSKSLGRPRDCTITATPDVKVIPIRLRGSSEKKFGCQSPKALEVCAWDKGLDKVDLFTDGLEYTVRTPRHTASSLTKKAALDALCLGLKMKGTDAVELVKLAGESPSRRAACFIKQAISPYYNPPVYSGPQYSPQPMAPMTDPQYQQSQYWPEQYHNEQWMPYSSFRSKRRI